mmetsp:Transcript_16793/g.54917  ORF Transcript_16793/g.54917 Transcript_16793/m.54917 type:complete len:202 (-) Transcript_16793:2505-3110(-)
MCKCRRFCRTWAVFTPTFLWLGRGSSISTFSLGLCRAGGSCRKRRSVCSTRTRWTSSLTSCVPLACASSGPRATQDLSRRGKRLQRLSRRRMMRSALKGFARWRLNWTQLRRRFCRTRASRGGSERSRSTSQRFRLCHSFSDAERTMKLSPRAHCSTGCQLTTSRSCTSSAGMTTTTSGPAQPSTKQRVNLSCRRGARLGL